MKDDDRGRRGRDLWGPEMAAERMIGKRYKASINKAGKCSVCKHREKTFDIFHCQNTPERQFPACMSDNGAGQFTVDAEAVQNAMKGNRRG